jgi:hypothetical protein
MYASEILFCSSCRVEHNGKNRYHMCEINHFKAFALCSCDVTADVNHLHVKRIHLESLVDHLYNVREDLNI